MTPEQKIKARALYEEGQSRGEIARHFGVTKNVIFGIASREKWGRDDPDPATLMQRMRALDEEMDGVLRATRDIGRLPG